MSGCYPGCFYYTDSCFRKDCKKTMSTFVMNGKTFRIVKDDGEKDMDCKTCAFRTIGDTRCVDVDYEHPDLPRCGSSMHHYEEVQE